MLEQADIATLQAELRDMHGKLNAIQLLLLQKAHADNKLGDWISEQDAMTLTGLGKTRLYQLRVTGAICASTLGGKAVFYRLSDFKVLLNKNVRKK